MSYPMTRSKSCIGFSCHIIYLADTIINLAYLFDYLDLCLIYSRLPSAFYPQSATSASSAIQPIDSRIIVINIKRRRYYTSAWQPIGFPTINKLHLVGCRIKLTGTPASQDLGPALELSRSPRPSCVRARRTPSANTPDGNAPSAGGRISRQQPGCYKICFTLHQANIESTY